MIVFTVVNLPYMYNIILGRPILNKIKVVIPTYHQGIKFSTPIGVGVVRSDPRESKQCYLMVVTLPKKPRLELPLSDP